ncbi:sag-related sequence srs15c, partial [Cystoisospora suis]
LTPSNNTLTITCGGGGKMVPDDYLTKFCAYGEDPGSCTSQAFTGLLPAFDQSWWVTKDNPA